MGRPKKKQAEKKVRVCISVSANFKDYLEDQSIFHGTTISHFVEECCNKALFEHNRGDKEQDAIAKRCGFFEPQWMDVVFKKSRLKAYPRPKGK